MNEDAVPTQSSDVVRYERSLVDREIQVRAKHPVLGKAIIAVTRTPKGSRHLGKRAELIGKVGEELQALTESGLVVLHDRSIPGTSGNIEHFVVGNHGVTVVRAATSRGRVRVTKKAVYVGGTDLTIVVNGLKTRIDTVRHMVGGDASVHGALALPREHKATLKEFGNIAVGPTQSLMNWLVEKHNATPPEVDIAGLAQSLNDVFIPAMLLEN